LTLKEGAVFLPEAVKEKKKALFLALTHRFAHEKEQEVFLPEPLNEKEKALFVAISLRFTHEKEQQFFYEFFQG
jgi:hypothetical protein